VTCATPPCPVVQESYFDVPWTQKLGTYRGNEIDEPIVLPYGALPKANTDWCTSNNLQQSDCMIETGINSIVGVDRTDTLYDWTNAAITGATRCPSSASYNVGECTITNGKKTIPYCDNPSTPKLPPPNNLPCIEVRLEFSMYWSRGNNVLVQRPFGNEWSVPPDAPPYNTGVVISDGTAYGQQVAWYMSHYCSSNQAAAINAVCNNDYFSENNDGFNLTQGGTLQGWPNVNASWSVFPNNSSDPNPPIGAVRGQLNHCAQFVPGTTTPLTTCTLAVAGFDFSDPVKGGTPGYTGQYMTQNAMLINSEQAHGWFNTALQNFSNTTTTTSLADLQRHFPWPGTWPGGRSLVPPFDWGSWVYARAVSNPFLGQYSFLGDPSAPNAARPDHFLYPRMCTPTDFVNGLTNGDASKLRQCSLNYEIHLNGWGGGTKGDQGCGVANNETCNSPWPNTTDWETAIGPNGAHITGSNQYGRTSFLLAGLPGMQLPVSIAKADKCARCLSVYEQVHNSSLFSLYLPIANEADTKWGQIGRNYGDDFLHTFLMTNHMESELNTFADGIRGRTLWHNEYRSKFEFLDATGMSPHQCTSIADGKTGPCFPAVKFPAAFTPATANAPYHNYTCDGCHVRNGSGVPIKIGNVLDPVLQGPAGCTGNSCYMTSGQYNPQNPVDYTFTGAIHPMKLVFFDLRRVGKSNNETVYSDPEGGTASAWTNKIMNFYGDSFHVTAPGYTYSWSYGKADDNRLVVRDGQGNPLKRFNKELNYEYVPQQVNLANSFSAPCTASDIVVPPPRAVPKSVWPVDAGGNADCNSVDGASVYNAIYTPIPFGNGDTRTQVGFMLLNGKRLGNLGAMETIPNGGLSDTPPPMSIRGFQQSQKSTLGSVTISGVSVPIYGQIPWNVGTRGGFNRPGVLPSDQKLTCGTDDQSLAKCWIGRFGWIGDRVSLEDQVANAAFIEMNMLTNNNTPKSTFPVRYNLPNCGPAFKSCVDSAKFDGNGNLTETDINRMADYARWIGDPTRSEFVVTLPDVITGEGIFRQLQCDTCHVIDKIPITDPNDTMLTPVFRARLATHVSPSLPFLSYLGTDLLLHDMGYLSQVGIRNPGTVLSGIRDAATGVVLPGMDNYVQKIRTPPLKGLRFNRFVTESYKNTVGYPTTTPPNPACDFLLHDGRACDAIEAAFLHDGPAIKKLKVIEGLNALDAKGLQQLRAFLYSL
jgi:Di-haem oxidoreductase, putative peroxidase